MEPRVIAVIGLSAVLVSGLAACSSASTEVVGPTSTTSASAAGTGRAADVAFAQSMVPHHEQAIEMADLALSPQAQASTQLRKLAEQIKAAQGPEIEQMTLWLRGWGAPTKMPGTSSDGGIEGMDHSGHDMAGMAVSGMMSDDQMRVLGQASGQNFDDMWLQMMIEHHQGAITMAEQIQRESDDPSVSALADQIITAQQGEISAMQGLLSAGDQR